MQVTGTSTTAIRSRGTRSARTPGSASISAPTASRRTTARATPTRRERPPELPAALRREHERQEPRRAVRVRENPGPNVPDRALRLQCGGHERVRRGPSLSRLLHGHDRRHRGRDVDRRLDHGHGRCRRVHHGNGDRSHFERNLRILNAVVAGDRAISGTIYHDLDANATVTLGEGTFARAAVQLYIDDGDGAIDADDLFAGATGTDGAGSTPSPASGTPPTGSSSIRGRSAPGAEGGSRRLGRADLRASRGGTHGSVYSYATDGALYGGRSAGPAPRTARASLTPLPPSTSSSVTLRPAVTKPASTGFQLQRGHEQRATAMTTASPAARSREGCASSSLTPTRFRWPAGRELRDRRRRVPVDRARSRAAGDHARR